MLRVVSWPTAQWPKPLVSRPPRYRVPLGIGAGETKTIRGVIADGQGFPFVARPSDEGSGGHDPPPGRVKEGDFLQVSFREACLPAGLVLAGRIDPPCKNVLIQITAKTRDDLPLSSRR